MIAKDLENNRLTLKGLAGEAFSFNPATCADKTTYEVQQIPVAKGEQLRWTRNEAVKGVRNGQLVTVEQVDAKGTATLIDAKGETMTLELSGQQYLDYALVSTTYSSQGKTAERVLASIDSTISKEGLYVAVSRAKRGLSLYTADKEKLYQKVQRSAGKNNPSDYLPLFNLVNPNAESQKAAESARELRGADQSEYVGDRVGERVAVSHRAAVRRDRTTQSRTEPVAGRTGGVTAEYVADVRGVVTGIEERRRAAEREGQAERIGEATEGVVSGAGQLERTAAAVARLDGELERQARELSGATNPTAGQRPSMQADGVAEVILRKIAPDDLARYQAQIVKEKAPEQPVKNKQQIEQERKLRRRREIYQQYAAPYADKSLRECDRLVVRQLMSELLAERGGQRLRDSEVTKVGSILLQGPVAQELKQTQGQEAGVEYAMEVLAEAQQVVEKAHQASRSRKRSQDKGMER